MASEPISGLTSATLPLDPSTLFAVVPPSEVGIATNKTTLSAVIDAVYKNINYVTVGTGGQYATIHDAYVAAEYNMWVISDITETTSTTYTHSLHIQFNNEITVTFNADVKLVAGNTTSSIAMNFLGKATLSFSLTTNGVFLDADVAISTGSYPSVLIKGSAVFINTSSASVTANPISAPTAIINNITYVTEGGINSYFNFINCKIDNFVLSPTTSLADCYGFKITGYGDVGSVNLSNDCSNSSVLFSVTDVGIGSVTSNNANGIPTCYMINSSCDNAHAIDQAIKFDLSASNGGERSFLQNARNIIAIPTGANGSNYVNCVIAGTNISGLTGGITKFEGCDFGGALYISNASAYFNFVDNTFKQGAEIAVSPTAGCNFVNCDFGIAGGSTTLTIDAGVTGTIVMGGRTNLAIVDNGTSTQIMPTPEIY